VTALFFEPILGDGGAIVPPNGYFKKLIEICKRHSIAVVADEALTGLGRTGKMFAVEHWGIQPDIMVIGKSLGGGFPLAAFIVTDRIADVFEYEDFSSTTGGNPVACVAGLATIKIIQKEGLCEKVAKLGEYLINELRKLASTFAIIGEIRGRGLFIGIEIVEEESRHPAPQKTKEIKHLMVEKGFLLDIFGESTLRLTPPLLIEREHLDRFVETFSLVLKQVVTSH